MTSASPIAGEVDVLVRLHRGQRPDAVAVAWPLPRNRGAALAASIRCARSCWMRWLSPLRNARASSTSAAYVVVVDPADAGRRAALDLVEQAGPGARREHRIRAAAQQERPLQRRQRAVDRPGRGERPEVVAGRRLRAAMLEHARKGMVAGDEDAGKRLVVAQQDVVARPQPLDQVGLEQQRLGLGMGGDELHRRRYPRPCGAGAGRAGPGWHRSRPASSGCAPCRRRAPRRWPSSIR